MTTKKVETVKTVEELKKELELAQLEMAKKQEELKKQMAEIKEQAKKLKADEKEAKKKLKEEEAKSRAEALAKLVSVEKKVNKTQMIREFMAEGMTIDDIQEETGWARKQILDRVWLIEQKLKKAGLL